ncbi:hypothetical protein F5Y15DRAFT_232560 [Xylariaceae sp. FL0016]|nr:hypothetical protein F5Y15DRAFT_232560 [Xylariaceae sp. FL0016]
MSSSGASSFIGECVINEATTSNTTSTGSGLVDSASSGLSKGAKAGIGVGASVGGIAVIAAVYYFCFVQRRHPQQVPGDSSAWVDQCSPDIQRTGAPQSCDLQELPNDHAFGISSGPCSYAPTAITENTVSQRLPGSEAHNWIPPEYTFPHLLAIPPAELGAEQGVEQPAELAVNSQPEDVACDPNHHSNGPPNT